MKYKVLGSRQEFYNNNYSLVPIRKKDRLAIMKWRNEQLYHLRQTKPLTESDQNYYFDHVVAKLFEQEQPNQILFSYLEGDKCIGYGGLVHINWMDRNAEISFIMATELEKEFFGFHWKKYLSLIDQVAFHQLTLRKIYTYAFDLRPHLYTAVEKAGFRQEARLKEHCYFDEQFIDVVIHSLTHRSISLLEATISDLAITFQWANNKSIRQYSLYQENIQWDEHENWFKNKIENPITCKYYIFRLNENPIGSIRFDIDDNKSAKISYLIDPVYQGKGLGNALLERGINKVLDCNIAIKKIIGVVHQENTASLRLFEKLNFSKKPVDEINFVQFELLINEA